MILVVHPREHGETHFGCWVEPEPGDVCIGCCVGTGLTPAEAESDARANLTLLATVPIGQEVRA